VSPAAKDLSVCAAVPSLRYTARVELSCKVVDTEAKLARTLCHELCHCAAWLVHHTIKPPHGAVFKQWAAVAMGVYPHLDITTCHNYEIHYAFKWRCLDARCVMCHWRTHCPSVMSVRPFRNWMHASPAGASPAAAACVFILSVVLS
jgi:SprT-like family